MHVLQPVTGVKQQGGISSCQQSHTYTHSVFYMKDTGKMFPYLKSHVFTSSMFISSMVPCFAC